ncbi:tRNA methyltransferase TYW3 KNAG_0D03180 [Huiozyma naganishii CBS 8797]|uniref:tRNA wybutosine-synthesizing protein 3 n=1 Tax=Huiozyma naganishii (strain ATCC MYA-139 / BCRC 22969 / CBS 8797 / KCTC 17520 / NBRC 10181 / NCYC 3082 / Yp74L-3) TaxID=1071383 RepID=J7S5X5_HUIN7|nr:hypothetical protein KNAG_0D03180 [Kazachstania naganishii CBS 8797]CCK70064.1 hypothetical protein KNAG_0D03180 [Kazachstania naganishii CBS 8797]
MAPKQNAFDQKKSAILSEIKSVSPDLSPKGSIDELCLPIIHLINSHEDMVTTSSCSGRLSVFAEGSKDVKSKIGGKGDGGKWLFVTHDKNAVSDWTSQFNFTVAKDMRTDSTTRYILYKYEPFILHVKCRDFASASQLYNTAMSCGFRESGIGSNHIVAVRISIKLDVPIGTFLDDQLQLFVEERYLSMLNNITLMKFQDNERKMRELYDKIQNEIIGKPLQETTAQPETKAERFERKRREGLERQRQLQK